MELSKRLLSVASGVSKGNRLADIGTDHGYIPIYLVTKEIVPFAIAMDVNQGPLERARFHIEEQGLKDKIETRLGSGLLPLHKQEVDSIVIAGMGGALITRILEEGKEVLEEGTELILQPQSEIYKVRHWLHDNGYQILWEDMVKEEGKFYFILKAIPGIQTFSEEYLYEYGEYLLQSGHELMKEYLKMELNKYKSIQKNLMNQSSDSAKQRKKEIDEKLKIIEKAYHYEM